MKKLAIGREKNDFFFEGRSTVGHQLVRARMPLLRFTPPATPPRVLWT